MMSERESSDSASEIEPKSLTEELRQERRSNEESSPLRRTETMASLKDRMLLREIEPENTLGKALDKPPVEDPVFPEEYRLETETGLVRAKTLQSLGRSITLISRAATRLAEEEQGTMSTQDKFAEDDIQFVTFQIDDPENPHNWKEWVKWVYTILLSVFVIAAAYGSSSLAGGLETINEHFHVSTEVSTLTVSLMVVGFALGPLIWAPLSEQIGRRPVYFVSFGLYVIFNIPCGVAPNIGTLLVCRLLCGVFASSALTIVGASLADMHNKSLGLSIAFFSFSPYSGPVFGGLVNGFISVGTGKYEDMIWVNLAFAGVMWIIVSFIPETYAPVILKRRARKLRKQTGNPKILTEQEAQPLSLKEMINTNLIKPLKFIVQEPVLDLVCAFVALIYALLYAFFFAYPYIFNKLYGYKDNIIGLMFVPILIGAGFSVITTPFLEHLYLRTSKRRKMEPEDRLIGALIGAPFPMMSLFLLGATSFKHVIWVGPASSGILFGYGMVLIYYSLNNYIIETYARYAASALATKVFIRSGLGAAFPLFVTQMYERLGLQWGSWLLAFISLAMVPIPFTFYKYGKRLRGKLCHEDYTIHHDE